jgi:uncharacterized phiE125 gp8 family phage protein
MLTDISPPPAEALPIAAFAAHLRLPEGFGTEDPGLEAHLRAALAAVEGMTGKGLLARPLLWRVARWRRRDRAELPLVPASALVSAELVRASGAREALARLALSGDGGAVIARGGGLPEIPQGDAAEIVVEAGFGGWEDIPADLRQAVLMLAAHFHEQRHAVGAPAAAPFGVEALVARHRRMRL